MPQFGRLTAASAISPAASAASNLPWKVPGATAQMVTFEVDVQATLDHLPDILSRPAPPYVRLMLVDYPASPIGAYREAMLLISCRYMMLPRQYVAASIVTSEAARDATQANWNYQSEVGQIEMTREGSRFTATVKAPNGLTISVDSQDAQETGNAVIRYDPIVVVRAGDEGGSPGLAAIWADPDAVHEAWLARDTTVSYSGGDRQGPWWKLRSLNPITSTIAVQDMEIGEPRPVRRAPTVSAG